MSALVLILILLLGLLLGWLSTSGSKTQWIRLADVFIYGPLLILAGFWMPVWWMSLILVFIGASTMAYNFHNYLTEARKETATQI